MGRTIPTANILLQKETNLFLRTYGKGLSSEREREALYNVLQLWKKQTQACSQVVRRVPFHAILMSLLLEQQKQLVDLTDEITALSENGGVPE
jgi:hypothetical protein